MKRCRWHLKPPPHFHKVPLHRNKVLVVLFGYALIFSHQNCYSVLCAEDDKSFKQGSTTPETSELQQELWRRTGKELNVFRSVLSLSINCDRSCSRTVKLRPSKGVGPTHGRNWALKRPQPPADLISSSIMGLQILGQLRMYRYKSSSILDELFIFVQMQWCTDLVHRKI